MLIYILKNINKKGMYEIVTTKLKTLWCEERFKIKSIPLFLNIEQEFLIPIFIALTRMVLHMGNTSNFVVFYNKSYVTV